jgi:D-arabinose 1-dehydrogenase-like Zn-dependent alcohol dehydrogenase
LVPGHEGIGIVSAVGNAVRNLKVGDRVGVGWIRDSCGECEYCSIGRENICLKGYQGTLLSSNAGCWGKEEYNNQGCFSKVVQVGEKFAYKVSFLKIMV